MRRIIIIGTALAALVGAAAAYAAYNSYTAKDTVSPSKAGSAAAPSPVGGTQDYTATGSGGGRAAPLTDIKVKVYGLVTDGKDFPKCTDAMIENAGAAKGYDKACPKGSLVASGPTNSILGPSNSNSSALGTPCNPLLHIYNGGQGKLVNFFVVDATHQCAGLRTGQTAPYDGTLTRQGKFLMEDTPLPADVSTNVAGISLYGSLVHQHLTFFKMTRKVHGKRVSITSSVGCSHGKRPWSYTFTASDYGGGTETQTVSGSNKC